MMNQQDLIQSINQKALELVDLFDANLPPVGEVMEAKKKITEALLWASKAIYQPETIS